jgi:GABA permease
VTQERDDQPADAVTHCEWCGVEYTPGEGAAGYRHRIVVIANEDCGSPALASELRSRAGDDGSDVLLVAPAGAVEEDAGAASDRLDAAIAALTADGIHVHGSLERGNPLGAIDDAVQTFHPDEVLIVTGPPGASRWLSDGVLEAARRSHHIPVRHLIAN